MTTALYFIQRNNPEEVPALMCRQCIEEILSFEPLQPGESIGTVSLDSNLWESDPCIWCGRDLFV